MMKETQNQNQEAESQALNLTIVLSYVQHLARLPLLFAPLFVREVLVPYHVQHRKSTPL